MFIRFGPVDFFGTKDTIQKKTRGWVCGPGLSHCREGFFVSHCDGVQAMSERFVFRSYERRDLEAMVELDAVCFAPPFRFSKVVMQRFAESANAWVRVIEREGVLAGFCIVHRERAELGNMGYVVTIDVAEQYRGQGLGERMLSEGETWVRGWKGAGMLLHVFTKNDGAVRFYERMQYRRVGVQIGFYGPDLDAAMYWKEFADTQPD